MARKGWVSNGLGGLGFRVWSLSSLGFRVQGLGFRRSPEEGLAERYITWFPF